MADDGDSSLVYWKSTEEEEAAQAEHETPERTRRNQVFILPGGGGVGGVVADWQQLTESDIVHTIDASHLIKHHLEKVQSENGGPEHFRDTWVVNVDRDVLSEFAKLGLV
jgi:hypothetical protein